MTRWLAGALLLLILIVGSSGAAEPPVAARKYQRTLTSAARVVWGLDAPIATFAGQVEQESAWHEKAKSYVGAQGLGQFMPSTAAWIDDVYPDELGPAQPYNPSWALRALVRYDRHLYERIPAADECEQMAMALASYNGGLTWLGRDQHACALRVDCDPLRWFGSVEKVNAGRAQWAWTENRGYPRAILLRRQATYATWGREVKCSGSSG